jgi:hypothetical protein
MKFSSAKSLLKELSYLPGWKTRDKIVVIESDDWGSLRMPSFEAFKRLENLGLDLRSADAERYNLNDNLASAHDLECLFEVLSKNRDRNHAPAVFTPACIVANPDFQKINESGFSAYFYEPFTETLKRFPGCESSFDLWKEGINKRLFVPQMHGREHLNITAWMKALQASDKNTLAAFKENVWGFVPEDFPRTDYQAAYLLGNPDELKLQEEIVQEGLKLFRNLFGYDAVYFVPPNGLINNKLNKSLFQNGIRFRYVARIQRESLGHGQSRKIFHWLGEKDPSGIRYILRNCFFEPGQAGKNRVDSCLHDVEVAFRWHKPAIICTHRANYTGTLNPANRDNGLKQLDMLLSSIMKTWPDVRFMTTAELGELMNGAE